MLKKKMILVASANPVKVNGTLAGFTRMFPGVIFKVKGREIDSGVSSQPVGDRETYQGAYNRATLAWRKYKGFDYYVGIEGGVQKWNDEFTAFAWIVIKSKKNIGKGKTETFFLPKKAATLINQGKELGEVMDILFNKINIKQDKGAIGILTNNVMNRTELYANAVIVALIPFKQRKLFHQHA